jgi:hypothetical protein
VDWIHVDKDKGPMEGLDECGYEPSGSIKGKDSSEWPIDHYLLKKDSVPWSYNSYTAMTCSQCVGSATM